MKKWYKVTDVRHRAYDYVQAETKDTACVTFMMRNGEPLFDDDLVAEELDESQVPYQFKKDAGVEV